MAGPSDKHALGWVSHTKTRDTQLNTSASRVRSLSEGPYRISNTIPWHGRSFGQAEPCFSAIGSALDLQNHLAKIGVSPSGKAAGFDPAIQRFESFHPRFCLRNSVSNSVSNSPLGKRKSKRNSKRNWKRNVRA